ncbi:MAG TPA: efflux RND transporter periplasmic adaptor subunit, partial [Bryobacteraceae bacterium]|nr:efflux RND transporter periplasmic adaptor subunit [Bryobacteraceae bacterium]
MNGIRMQQSVTLLAGGCLLAALAGCGNRGEKASQMTSYTGGASKADTPALFAVPADEMSHVQVVKAVKGSIPHVLRFTGSVAYDANNTTPVFSAVGGPVREIFVMPGDMVKTGQPLLEVRSPDYSSALAAYQKARDAFQLADKNYKR